MLMESALGRRNVLETSERGFLVGKDRDMTAKTKTDFNLKRIGEEIDILLTEIYGEYVAKGSPTKLGGLRFLDVPSAKTFAFEKTRSLDDGNLLVISAPLVGDSEIVKKRMAEGPHSKSCHEIAVRTSSDAGKGGKYFMELSYVLPTSSWLPNEAIREVAEEEACSGNDAVMLILKRKALPIARDVMAYFIEVVREHSKDDAIV